MCKIFCTFAAEMKNKGYLYALYALFLKFFGDFFIYFLIFL